MSSATKNILVYVFAVAVAGGLFYLYYERDREILESMSRWGRRNEVPVIRETEDEKRIARQFSDSTLPELKRLGLITSYSRTEIETIITVSGRLWKERSAFFKESLLTQILIYNRVNGYAPTTKIYDDRTQQLYAQIVSPDRKEILDSSAS